MSQATLLWCLVAGFFFGGWQLVMRASNLKDPFVAAFLLNVATVITLMPFVRGRVNTPTLFSLGILIAIAAGVMNGLGHAINSRLVLDRGEELMRFGAVVPAVVVLVNVAGGRIFYGEKFSGLKFVGILLILGGIKLLAGK